MYRINGLFGQEALAASALIIAKLIAIRGTAYDIDVPWCNDHAVYKIAVSVVMRDKRTRSREVAPTPPDVLVELFETAFDLAQRECDEAALAIRAARSHVVDGRCFAVAATPSVSVTCFDQSQTEAFVAYKLIRKSSRRISIKVTTFFVGFHFRSRSSF